MNQIQTIIMKVAMHCDGCARKVRKTLSNMAGVEELRVVYSEQKVIVKGAIDPNKVLQKVSKAGKAVQILEITTEPPKLAEDAAVAEPLMEGPPPKVDLHSKQKNFLSLPPGKSVTIPKAVSNLWPI